MFLLVTLNINPSPPGDVGGSFIFSSSLLEVGKGAGRGVAGSYEYAATNNTEIKLIV